MKLTAAAIFSLVGFGLLVSPAMASVASATPAATFHNSHVTFTYPAHWSKLATSQAKSFGKGLGSSGYVSIDTVVGVEHLVSASNFGVAVLAKMSFTKSFRKKLKGNRALFLKKFKQGVSGQAKRVISQGTAPFAGSPSSTEIQVLLSSGGVQTHDAFYIHIPSDGKSVDMAIMVVSGPSKWNKYKSALAGIAASSRFH